ncbi:MAG: DUF3326 domain-containing protein [Bryobacteraceae bacterium]
MQIENVVLRLSPERRPTWIESIGAPFAAALGPDRYPLRFSIVDATASNVTIEATVVRFERGPWTETLAEIEILSPRRKKPGNGRFCAVQIIPTGVRCEFGGYAGDATPATNLLAAATDYLVTHPNAVNASELNEKADNVLYVEGKALDDFLLGHIGLAPVAANRIGTFVDPTGAQLLDYVINALNAAAATAGIACEPYTMLHEEIGVKIEWSETGCAVGSVVHPEVILDGVRSLLDHGVDAIGGVSVIHGVTKEMFDKHMAGLIPNPSGGVEAIITHLITKLFRVPAAHAPLPYYTSLKGTHTENPRAAAEFISTPHYFCVLKGLSRAPRLEAIESLDTAPSRLVTVNDVAAVVLPSSCLGGIPALAAEFSGIPVIAVRENSTVLAVDNRVMRMANVIEVESYLEAAGVLLALRQGISLASLRRPMHGCYEIARQAHSVPVTAS